EPNETFTITLSSPTNATLGTTVMTGTIQNDDGDPALSVESVAVAESAGAATFTVSLLPASAQTVTVNYATTDGTATAGSDYTSASGALTFAAGETSKTVVVSITNDSLDEANETFTLSLSGATGGASILTSQATATITDDDPAPTLSINDATAATEGGAATFTVTLSTASGQTVTVAYATASGTATSGNDFTATSGSLTFAAGETTKTFTVATTDDATDESDETFVVNLTSPTNATLSDAQGLGTITDNDGPAISINDITLTEGSGGATTATFTVSLSAASPQTITVAYATLDGSAIGGTDYTATSGTLTLAIGATNGSITVSVAADTTDESDETFTVSLSSPTNATLADASGIATIIDDDGPSISVADASVTEGGAASVTVSLSAASPQIVSVEYATANGAATAGTDYTATSGTVSFPIGQTTQTVSVSTTDDTVRESDETFTVNLANATNGTISDAAGLVTIVDNDADVSLSVSDETVTEGNSGATTATFTVTLSGASGSTVTVGYATSDGSATAGDDYVSVSGSLSFAAGETSKTFTVTVLGDALNEPTETFTATLSNATNASISDATGIGTITNDDGAPTLSIADATATEGDSGNVAVTLTVTLSAASGQSVTVAYATADGTATSGSDYVAASGALTFGANETTATITVEVSGDQVDELDETFTVNLTNPTNAGIADAQGQVTITDDDAPPTLTVGSSTVTEGDSGATTVSVPVTLTGATSQIVTVNYATSDGAATSGSDYTAASGALTFAVGESAKSISVTILGDTMDEDDETFAVMLSSPTNATLGTATANVTITDDDAPPSIRIEAATATEGGVMTFTLALSAVSAKTVTVQYATANGVAAAGSDYTAASGTATIPAGSLTTTISVTTTSDTVDETNETFVVNLSNATNTTISGGQATGTIIDDDGPTIFIDDATVTERNSGTTLAAFVVHLSAASPQTITVQYATADGSATAGSDYTAKSGALTFAAGTTSQSVTVSVIGDTTTESDETFFLNLTNPTNATNADAQAVGTIANDDSFSASINSATVTEGSSGATTATLTVTLSGESNGAISVAYSTADDSATAGSDYTATSGTLTFATGEVTKTISVPVTPDTVDEADETFVVNLTNPTNVTLTNTQGTVTITDDDGSSISVADISLAEGDSGTTGAVFTVALSAASAQRVTVNYATANGAATSGSDYVAVGGTLAFETGELSKSVTVPVIGDTTTEGDETFTLVLSNTTNATIATPSAQATIREDDAPPTLTGTTELTVISGRSGAVALTVTDPDTTAFTFAVSRQPSGGAVEIDTTRRSVIYTANATYTGVDRVEITVSDGKTTSAPLAIIVTVLRPNQPPRLSPVTTTTRRNTPVTIPLAATDPENDAVTFRIATPAASGQTNLIDKTVVYTPNTDFTGTDTFTVVPNDGRDNGQAATITVQVQPDNRPTVRNTARSLDNLRVTSGAAPFVIELGGNTPLFLNPDRAPALSASSSNTGVVATALNGTLLTLTFGSAGVATVTARAETAQDAVSFAVEVVDATQGDGTPLRFGNVRPQLFAAGVTGTFALTTEGGNGAIRFALDRVEAVTAAASGDAAPEVTVGPTTGIVTFLVSAMNSPQREFVATFTATDTTNTTVSTSVGVRVRKQNRPPIVTADTFVAAEAGSLAILTVSATDPDNDSVTIEAYSDNTNAALQAAIRAFNTATAAKNGDAFVKELRFTPPQEINNAVVTLRWTGDDGIGSTAEATQLRVGAVGNLAPRVTPVPEQTVDEGGTWQLVLSATDPDSDPLFWDATSLPTGLTFDATTGTLLWANIPFDRAGSYVLRATVRDRQDASDPSVKATPLAITLLVRDVNRLPTFGAVADAITLTRGETFQLAVPASDPDSDRLTLTAANPPTWARIETATGGFRIVFTTPQDATSRQMRLILRDPLGGIA
ncbi:MAG: Ig-like domain-containing protein, partial [Candidatus Poribacteria bacterium]|nr:Ig-like domain-containing protein [Candidatus Poribacteria bacterium]